MSIVWYCLSLFSTPTHVWKQRWEKSYFNSTEQREGLSSHSNQVEVTFRWLSFIDGLHKNFFSTKIIISSIMVNSDIFEFHFPLQKAYFVEYFEDIKRNSNNSFQCKQHFRILQKQTKRPPQTYICRRDACATKTLTKVLFVANIKFPYECVYRVIWEVL